MALINGQNKRPVKTVNRANTKKAKEAGKTKPDTNKKTAKKEETEEYGLKEEVVILSAFACAAILVLSNFELAGSVGRAIKWILFGFIGVMEYFFPFVAAGTIIFLSVNKKYIKAARIKSIAVYGLMVVLAGMWQRITNYPRIDGNIFDFFTICANEKRGGGFFGGLICKILHPLGAVGSFVIMLALLIICIVVITEKSFIKGMKNAKNKSTEFLKVAKEEYSNYRESNRLELENAQDDFDGDLEETNKDKSADSPMNKVKSVSRMGKKARGVTSDILITDTATKPEDEDVDIEGINRSSAETDEYSDDIYDPNDNIQIFNGFNSSLIEDEIVGNHDDLEPYKDQEAFESDEIPSVNAVNDNVVNDNAVNDNATRETLTDTYANPKSKNDDATKSHLKYRKPDINCLNKSKQKAVLGCVKGKNDEIANTLRQTLLNFGVAVDVVGISYGPSVTRYEIQPEQGVKVSKIVSLADDIKLSLAAADIRIEAPIPGKSAIGIEVPNKEPVAVGLRELIESKEFKNSKSKLVFATGRDIAGKVILADIAKMPHMLIAGATGSGKSVCINTIITSILYNASPEDVRMILVDPKVVELSVYNGIPHLAEKVVTDPKEAAKALNWAVIEMDRRYKDFAKYGVRNLEGYNEKVAKGEVIDDAGEVIKDKKPQILIIIDELADLMMVSANEVEDAICRLAQLARAAGIHMVIATQRPSVNVVTGLIKANVPSRIAFAVSSGVDSRTILDMNGAEKLLGKGDMLYFPSNIPKPIRVQGAFVTDNEVAAIVEDVKKKNPPVVYDESISKTEIGAAFVGQSSANDDRDSLFADAGRFVIENEKGSIGMLQRHFKIGFNRAGRIMDQLFEAGVVGQEMGTKPRKIEMSIADFEKMLGSNPGQSA